MTAVSKFTYRLVTIFIIIAVGLALLPQTGQAQTGTSYPIVDTGQSQCYNAAGSVITCPAAGEDFYGQDAQYTGHTPGYTNNGNGTITDNVTGLMWQKSPDTNNDGAITAADKLTYDQAVAGAGPFNLAGYNDWRLPTIKEFYSLIRFDGTDPSGPPGSVVTLIPFIDTAYFDFAYGDPAAGERTIDSQYASSTKYVSTTMNGAETMFGVNFADGRIKGYGLTMPGGGNEKTFFVLYVRGNTAYGQNNFIDNGNETITDNATGLMWQQDDSGKGLNWAEALTYCESLDNAGYTDWRLPNAKELQSIVDYNRSPDTTGSAAIDPQFNATPITNEAGQTDFPAYWSSTTHANLMNGMNAAYVAFGRSLGYMHNSWVDVHGAGSQRSAPKVGDPANYPTGHGPQGDAIRIYNYARCMRGGNTTGTPDGGSSANRSGITVEMSDINQQQPGQQLRPEDGLPPSDRQNGSAGPPVNNQQQGPRGTPPPEAIAACSGQSQGASCRFTGPHGEITGTCSQIQQQLARVPAGGRP
ncbi:MAG: DUF1566 domain-containing protein [Anaerolineae bacterium]|nr:DUF1566 domain-containing protein [Anaerolineae bacterium]